MAVKNEVWQYDPSENFEKFDNFDSFMTWRPDFSRYISLNASTMVLNERTDSKLNLPRMNWILICFDDPNGKEILMCHMMGSEKNLLYFFNDTSLVATTPVSMNRQEDTTLFTSPMQL